MKSNTNSLRIVGFLQNSAIGWRRCTPVGGTLKILTTHNDSEKLFKKLYIANIVNTCDYMRSVCFLLIVWFAAYCHHTNIHDTLTLFPSNKLSKRHRFQDAASHFIDAKRTNHSQVRDDDHESRLRWQQTRTKQHLAPDHVTIQFVQLPW